MFDTCDVEVFIKESNISAAKSFGLSCFSFSMLQPKRKTSAWTRRFGRKNKWVWETNARVVCTANLVHHEISPFHGPDGTPPVRIHLPFPRFFRVTARKSDTSRSPVRKVSTQFFAVRRVWGVRMWVATLKSKSEKWFVRYELIAQKTKQFHPNH